MIDPQRSFTDGAWARSMGARGQAEVAVLRLAFGNVAERLRAEPLPSFRAAFTRCGDG